jgi:peroxiredoxin Q/BCP
MEAYRDQYATIFRGGKDVVALGVSADPDTTLVSWAREKDFPMVFASDAEGRVGRLYDSYDAKARLDTRTLFVIAPDGKVAYVARPFNVLSQDAYRELGAAVEKSAAAARTSDTH